MKNTIILLFAFFCYTKNIISQEAYNPFHKSYTRLGIQNIGEKLDNALSPESNILSGKQGASLGFVLEKGHIYYFMPKAKAKMINAGLDWTILSITYNSSKKGWQDYVKNNTGYSDEDFTVKLLVSLSTKIGPVITINPTEKLAIDVRTQIGLGVYAIGPVYSSSNSSTDNEFYPYREDGDASGFKAMTQYLSTTGIRPNIGATVRWGGIGISADYSPGKVKMIYTSINNGLETHGNKKIPLNSFQVKLTISKK